MKILQVDKTIEADPELNDSDGFVTTHKLTSSWIPAFAGIQLLFLLFYFRTRSLLGS
jgi:hypothetical protein